MRLLVRAIVCLSILALSACGGMAKLNRDYILLDALPVSSEQNPKKSTVTFIREKAYIGSAITYFIWEDDHTVGVLKSGSQFVLPVDPGKRTFWAYTESKEFITLQVEEGSNYCIVGGVGVGMWAGRPTLKQTDMDVCNMLSKGLPYSNLTAKGVRTFTPPKEKEPVKRPPITEVKQGF